MSQINAFIVDIPKRLDYNSVIHTIKLLNKYEKTKNLQRLIINFTQTQFVKPGGLTPLLAYLMGLPKKKENFSALIIPSMRAEIDLYISRMGFYSLLGIEDDFPYQKHSSLGRFQELYSFSKTTDINEVAETSQNIIKMFIKNKNLENYNKAIGWCIFETIDNARNHANSDINVVFAQNYKEKRISEFCVCDRGVGIRETMGENSIEKALKKCITKAKGINSDGMGNGLYFTSELIKRDKSRKSSMSIWSENAILTIKNGFDPVIEKTDGYWQGVNIVISMYNNISTNLTELKKGFDPFDYQENPDYYNSLFEN